MTNDKEDIYKPIADSLEAERKRIIRDFTRKLDIDDFDNLMNAIANEFGVEEIIDWIKEQGVM